MTPYAAYPLGRPRRLRRDSFTRNLVREHTLTVATGQKSSSQKGRGTEAGT